LPSVGHDPILGGVRIRNPHVLIDRVNAAEDRRIATRLRRDPRVLRMARSNLRRWAAANGRNVRPVFQEWHAILHRLNAGEIADFLCSNTPMARRLQQSSPFAGALTQAERRTIRLEHETAGA
jgi:hypothetical protein